jgi:hypothetical protein
VTEHPRSRQKYWFTPAMDEEIRSAYHLFIEDNNRRAIGACARKLRLPRWMITRRAAILGLARIKEPEWSIAEIIVLEQCGHLTPAVIRRKLRAKGFRRSANAIRLKIGRMRIKQNLEGYSARALARAFGVDCHKVMNWINRKMLGGTPRGSARHESHGVDAYWITHADVREFVLTHPDEVDLRRVEKWWFLDLVTDGRIGIR